MFFKRKNFLIKHIATDNLLTLYLDIHTHRHTHKLGTHIYLECEIKNFPLSFYFNIPCNTLITVIDMGDVPSSFKILTLHISAHTLPPSSSFSDSPPDLPSVISVAKATLYLL